MTARIVCFHCGEAVDRPGTWRTAIDGVEREMCCVGCRAVAEAIAAAGLTDYYRTRSAPAAAGVLPEGLEALRIWDDDDVQARFVRAGDDDREASLLVDGLRCGACVWLLEQTLRRQPGVVAASVNLATERATIRWNPATTQLSRLLEAIGRIGYAARPSDARGREQQIQRTTKALFRRLFIATLAMMQVMMYAFPSYIAAPGEIEPAHESLMRWASLLLTVPVVFYSATPFLAGAWRDLRARSLGMDVPVTIGVLAAFAASAHATVSGRGEVYFDSVTMFVCLLLAARYVEWIARRRAGRAIDAVAAAAPDSADRIDPDSGAIERVPATRLAAGDRFRVSVGERIAVDARVVEGRTAIDASLLTGESLPVAREPGDEVPGGAVNAGSAFVAQALRASSDSAISTIERLIDRAAADKPRLAGLAERVARVFVAALLLLAAGVWLAWMQIDPARAAPIAIAVLVVSCPCALSMAMPAALAAATGAAIRRGMLVARGDALERIAGCTDFVFDKTGTLTEGRPEVVRVVALAPAADDGGAAEDDADRFDDGTRPARDASTVLGLAAALEAGQSHPLAAAILRAAKAHGIDPQADAGEPTPASAPGLGVEALVRGRRYRLGSHAYVSQWHPSIALPAEYDGDTLVWLVDERRPIARLHFRDRLRDEARAVVDTLAARGLRVHLLSGDRAASAGAVARELAIEEVAAEAGPSDKLEYVRALQRDGRRVAMVGDGVNDAPVLAAADVSVAVGEATSLARTAASVVLLGGSLRELVELHALASRTRRVVRQNLGWALGYNAIAIPAAALGWVAPWLAALGMTASSLFVVLNALRLIPGTRGGTKPSPAHAADVRVDPAPPAATRKAAASI
ncbi:MAG TPA: heavy metal translocating P-type ATPase [Zeimonas sp.]|nr:heavy metal translocating P-type ATPase [Zeimonas sp.]